MNQFQSIDEVLSVFKRRFWVIVAIAVVGSIATFNHALNQAKLYQATAVVQIEDAAAPNQFVNGGATRRDDTTRAVRLIEQRLMSRDNLLRVINDHGLFMQDPGETLSERASNMREAIRIAQIRDQSQGFVPGGVAPSGLMIHVTLDNPQKAADVANDLMAYVISQTRDRSALRARDALDFFATEERRVGAEIEQLETRISAYQQQNAEQLPSGIRDLRSQLAQLEAADLELDREIVALGNTSGRQRQDVKDREEALLREQKLLIAERVAEIQALLVGAPEVERGMNALERELTKLQEQYALIATRKADAEMGQMLQDRQDAGRFQVLEEALVPEYPISRSRKKTAIIGAFGSLLAGIAVAFVIELANPAIRTPSQLERALGITPVVSIPVIMTGTDTRKKKLGRAGKIGIFALIVLGAAKMLAGNVPWLQNLFGLSTGEG
ncbi:MAG: Wzz/FepE/Etk N-terminal domain-containing protein [Pelagimonas sp.]|jgi:uncharacterized protein involved in exopolysaccharide biosynthesis|nr:Wzz/FepE/Etk N-terminal domain-containing protein [Pelagimonas sp.]